LKVILNPDYDYFDALIVGTADYIFLIKVGLEAVSY